MYGRPSFGPQARTNTVGVSPPARGSLKTEIGQIGEALQWAGSALSEQFKQMAAKETQEGLEKGSSETIRAARSHKYGLEDFLRNMEDTHNWHNASNPYVNKGSKIAAGTVWARSPHVASALDEDRNTVINDWVAFQDGDEKEFQDFLDVQIFGPRIAELESVLPNSYYARSIGFQNNLAPILNEKRRQWTAIMLERRSAANLEGIHRTMGTLWKGNTIEETLNWWSWGNLAGEVDPEDVDPEKRSESYQATAPWKTIETSKNGKGVLFSTIENHVLNDLIKDPRDLGYEESIKHALSRLKAIANSKLPNTGAALNTGSMAPHYGALELKLEDALAKLDGIKSEKLKAASIVAAKDWGSLIEATGGAHASPVGAKPMDKRDVSTKGLKNDPPYEPGSTLSLAEPIDDPTDVPRWYEAFRKGLVSDPRNPLQRLQNLPRDVDEVHAKQIEGIDSNGEKYKYWIRDKEAPLVKNPMFDNPYVPTLASMNLADDAARLQAMQSRVTAINILRGKNIENVAKRKLAGINTVKDLETALVQKTIGELLGAGEAVGRDIGKLKVGDKHFKYSEKDILDTIEPNSQALYAAQRARGMAVNNREAYEAASLYMRTHHPDSRKKRPSGWAIKDLETFMKPGELDKWIHMNPAQVEAHLILEGYDMSIIPVLKKVASDTGKGFRDYLQLDNLGGNARISRGRKIKAQMYRDLVDTSPADVEHGEEMSLFKYLALNKQQLAVDDELLVSRGYAQILLHQKMDTFLRSNYYDMITTLAKEFNYNFEHPTVLKALEDAMSATDKPVTYPVKNAAGELEEKQLLPKSLTRMFRDLAGTHPDGKKRSFQSFLKLETLRLQGGGK